MKKICVIMLLFAIGCQEKAPVKMNAENVKRDAVTKAEPDSITEFYNDSLHIGKSGKHRLELRRIMGKDSVYADIRFFEKQGKKWFEIQHFAYGKDGITGCDPEFKDFNNDGNYDFTYKCAVAVRGANDMRYLFVFDPKSGKLKFIKNSDQYPNLQYNEKLDCIDAFAVYGGSTSYFLKIDTDSLKTFARIDLFNGYREIYKTDKTGKEVLVKREPFETSYLRYKNFDPLEEYEKF